MAARSRTRIRRPCFAAARQWELAPGGAIVLTAVAVFAVTTIGAGLVRHAGAGSVVPQL